jgi:hypothetical protein
MRSNVYRALKLEWRFRWVQTFGGDSTLHRVTRAAHLEEQHWVGFTGVKTACGLYLPKVVMPGILSRMKAPRCWECCQALGIPQGFGAPFNNKYLTWEERNA